MFRKTKTILVPYKSELKISNLKLTTVSKIFGKNIKIVLSQSNIVSN